MCRCVFSAELGMTPRLINCFDAQVNLCVFSGIRRLDRWERAAKYELQPDPRVREILMNYSNSSIAQESLWQNYAL